MPPKVNKNIKLNDLKKNNQAINKNKPNKLNKPSKFKNSFDNGSISNSSGLSETNSSDSSTDYFDDDIPKSNKFKSNKEDSLDEFDNDNESNTSSKSISSDSYNDDDDSDGDGDDKNTKNTKNTKNKKNAIAENDNCYFDYVNFDIDNNDQNISTKSKSVIIDKDNRVTKPILTIYERVRILGERAKQLSAGAKPMLKGTDDYTPKEIAKLELQYGVIPFIVERTLPNGIREQWKVSELKIMN